jgi:hypothetical protein
MVPVSRCFGVRTTICSPEMPQEASRIDRDVDRGVVAPRRVVSSAATIMTTVYPYLVTYISYSYLSRDDDRYYDQGKVS